MASDAENDIPSHTDAQGGTGSLDNNEYSASRPGKVRLKSRDSRSKQSRDRKRPREDDHYEGDRYRRRHSHRHRHRRHHKDDEPEEYRSPPVSPTTAFRESLFDALADDEGADYWQAVYGQPIHTYARPDTETDERGELERMSDEEYAAYVRARMWEKTHQGLLEERERRRQVREAQKAEARRQGSSSRSETEREAFDRMVEESLQRGKERKVKKEKSSSWLGIWKRYLDCWDELNRVAQDGQPSARGGDSLRTLLVWPVESGKQKDVSADAVKLFLHNAPVPQATSEDPKSRHSNHSNMLAVLKLERVRWHPDKIRHRYGAFGVDEAMIKAATEIFQILDRIWVEEQTKS